MKENKQDDGFKALNPSIGKNGKQLNSCALPMGYKIIKSLWKKTIWKYL